VEEHRLVQTLQLDAAPFTKVQPSRPCQLPNQVGDKDLASAALLSDTGRDADGPAMDIATFMDDLADVKPDPYPQVGLIRQLALDRTGALKRAPGGNEPHQEAVTHRLDLPPAELDQDGADDRLLLPYQLTGGNVAESPLQCG
jgi:hypothetical protein